MCENVPFIDSSEQSCKILGDMLYLENREVLMADTEINSIFDIPPDEAEEARLDAQAEAEIDAGKGVPHKQVREWLLKIGRGEKVPPPFV